MCDNSWHQEEGKLECELDSHLDEGNKGLQSLLQNQSKARQPLLNEKR